MGWFDKAFSGTKREPTDAHGQPINQRYRGQAVQGRQIDELIGLVKGVLADGVVCQQEVEFLLRWLEANRNATSEWPASVLYPRLVAAMADGHLDEEEEAEIMALLLQTVGGTSVPDQDNGDAASNSTSLPLSAPPPIIQVPDHTFCFTGKFASGTRAWCESVVLERGGAAQSNITKKLNFLVIGEIGSRDWLHSTHGLKIKKAVGYRDSGVPLHIISEQYWHQELLG
ncbi:MAG: BRCT domain-containing protein [Castellaniella sp.]|uniref:BRCT domain-containing protein n=1 Tax=Castellaniella sp. TaxID=1955812 RepID=UPI003C73EE5D